MEDREHRGADEPKSKGGRLGWLRGLLYAVGIFLVLAAGLLLLAGTGPVLRLAMPRIEKAVSAAIDGRLAVAGISGSLWTGLTVDHLSLLIPATGLAVEGRGLALRWSPLALLQGTVAIDRLAAESLTVALPQHPGPEKPPAKSAGGPSLPLAVRLGRLDLPQVEIAVPGRGRTFSYALTASGSAGKRAAELALNLTPREADLDRLRVDLAFHADRRELRAEIDGRFDRAGLVMTLAGLPPEKATDLGIVLRGEGPAEDWRGHLRVAAADLAELTGDLGLQLGQGRPGQLGFSFTGGAGTAGQLAADLPKPLQGTVAIGLAGRYEMEAEKLNLSQLELTKPELLNVSGSAELDLAANRLDAALQGGIEAAASVLAGDAVKWRQVAFSGTAQGDPAMPDLNLTVQARSVATPAFASRDLSVQLQSVARGDRLAVQAQGTASGNEWPDYLRAILRERLDLDLAAEVTRDFREITIDRLEATAAELRLTGRAALNDRGAVSAAQVALDAVDLGAFSALTGLELHGAGRLSLMDGGWDATHGGKAGIAFTAHDLGLGQADLDRLVGPQPTLSGQIELSPRQDLAVRLHRVDLAGVKGSAAVNFTDGFARMAVSGELAVLPGALPAGIGVTLPQAASLAVQLDGPTKAPAGEFQVTAPQVEAGGERFDRLHLSSTMQWSDQAVLSFVNRGDFVLHDTPYRLAADVSLPPDRLQLSRLALEGEGLGLAGELSLPGYGPPLRGTLGLSRLDAGVVQAWVPLTAGQLSGKIDFLPEEKKQRLGVDFTARGLRLGAGEQGLDRLVLRGQVSDAFGEPAFALQLDGGQIAYAGTVIDQLQTTLRGPLKQLRVAVEATGRIQAQESIPWSVSAAADMGLAEDVRVQVGKLAAGIGTEKISLQQPLRLTRAADGTMDGAGTLTVGDGHNQARTGRIDGAFRLTPAKELSARAELAGIALGPWDAMFTRRGLTGVLALSADLGEQAGRATRAQLHLSIGDIRFASLAGTAGRGTAVRGNTSQLPPLSLQLDASLAAARLNGSLSLGAAAEQVLTARGEMPLTVSVLDGQYAFDPKAPLALQVDADCEIARFWPYVPLPDHSLSGRLKLAAALSGSYSSPDLTGTVALTEGRYEHLRFGTLLQHIRIAGRLDPRGVHFSEIAADDGGKGRLTGTAELETGGTRTAYSAALVMRNMAVTRMDELKLLGDIDLHITGDERQAAVRGEVKVDRGEVDLAVALPVSVPQLKVENLPQPGEGDKRTNKGRAKPEKEQTSETFAADLQVSIDIPGQLFVRGKGLDSEWAGKLDITGAAAEPRLVGQLQARRGQLDVIGKTFLIRDSQITFLGGQPPDPELNIVGVHTAGDLEVTANLKGPASKTELTLSSNPQMPQDEILSRILFGKSQGKLSPYEAVQLAGVATDLTGQGGFDVLGTLRKILRVDVLRVEGGEQGPQVEVGKYLTEGVYVGTKRGTTADTTGVEVEIELTPHIKATSETNEIDNKAGLQFKWDY